MPKVTDPNTWEFAKFALERNDEAIRFSETKAALIFTLIGLFLGIIADKIPLFKDLFQSPSCTIRILSIISMVIILFGIVLVVTFSLAAVFPRLRISKETSYLFFTDVANLGEQETITHISSLNSNDKLKHTLAQVYSTSVIANRKFNLLRYALVGTVIVLLGLLLAILTIFLV